jgi:molybdopterin-guanine dinucleotide biosynthesis protein B
VVLVGPERLALIRKLEQQSSSHELAGLVSDADIVIQEGFKKEAKNKIEVFRNGVSGERPLCMDDASFLALVSDRPFDVKIPRFDLDDAEGVAGFIVEKFVRMNAGGRS